MYSRCGDIKSSWITFENPKVKDVVSWTAIILAYANHGLGNKALQAFAQILRSGNNPDEITFVGLLSACSHAGLVKKGQQFFESMRHGYCLKPRAEQYCCLVDILGRGKLRVVRQMPPEDCDGAVLGALLGACKLYGDVEVANQICDEIVELEPGNSGANVNKKTMAKMNILKGDIEKQLSIYSQEELVNKVTPSCVCYVTIIFLWSKKISFRVQGGREMQCCNGSWW